MFDRPAKLIVVVALFYFLLLSLASVSWARTREEQRPKITPGTAAVTAADAEVRVHNVGKFWLAVTNYGKFGSESGGLKDPCTGKSAPSGEFPQGTGVNYLFQGALWIGAIVGEGDTLVSVGADGWEATQEYIAEGPFQTRTIRPSGIQQGSCFIPYSPDAISEQDYIASYADTCYDPIICEIDPNDKILKPLGLKVTQKSYAWSYDYAEDFVLFDYVIENVGPFSKLRDVYIALYIDADNHNFELDGQGYRDDISGFRHSIQSFACPLLYQDTINLAWTGDNDGLSNCSCPDKKGVFLPTYSPTSVAGTRVVKAPGELKFSFNWWNSETDKTLDWGPWLRSNHDIRPGFEEGALGTPVGNRAKYFIMSNNEFDYDQTFSALDIWADSGWLADQSDPTTRCDRANGYDTRYLLSFGPFNIKQGEQLPLTLAYVAGEDFHVHPDDYDKYYNCQSADAAFNYYSLLDFTDVGTNARWAGWVYDNPGVDTDSLTDPLPKDDPLRKGLYRICEGETVYYEGDGAPDFTGPPPPKVPDLHFEPSEGVVKVKWNGFETETGLDNFSNEADFEGYRVYVSRTGFSNDYALLNSYDKIDYKMYVKTASKPKWVLKHASLSPDSIVRLFAQDNGCCYSDGDSCVCLPPEYCDDPGKFGNDPSVWNLSHPYQFRGSCDSVLVISSSVKVERNDLVAFEPQDWNQDLNVLKVYKKEIEQGQITPADSEYYVYEYVIDGLNPSQPVHVAVTAFDYGNPQTGLSPLETSVLVNSKPVWPLNSPSNIGNKRVLVFPNPYKISEEYPGEQRSLPSGKRIHFVQLPGRCTIRIYTLDGDEVAKLENTDPNNPELSWNLLSSNSQEVVAGIYIYHVESERGSQIGKFVVVK